MGSKSSTPPFPDSLTPENNKPSEVRVARTDHSIQSDPEYEEPQEQQLTGKQIKQMKEFLRKYELRYLTYSQMWEIYKHNALKPEFENTKRSAIFLIIAPAATNLYYMMRPTPISAKFMPFVVPLACIAQYCLVLRGDIQNYCYSENSDAKTLREKYVILNYIQSNNSAFNKIVEDISQYEKNSQQPTISLDNQQMSITQSK